MRVLFLTHRLPYAPNRGDRIRAYHLLREMTRWADVSLFSLVHDDEEEAESASVPLARPVVTARVPHVGNYVRGAIRLATSRPLTHSLLDASDAKKKLAAMVAAEPPDVVLAYGSGMARFAMEPPLAGLPFVLDMVDVDSEKWRSLAGLAPPARRWVYAREARTLSAFERAASERARAALVVNERELQALQRIAPHANVQVVGIGIELEEFRPTRMPTRDPVVAFTGMMDYEPNVAAAMWFAGEIWPRVLAARPDARFLIVGAEPTRAVLALAGRDPSIEVTGRVDAVQPYLWRAALAVAPMLTARGLQNKVLESLAAGLPVVVTSAVHAGLPAGVEKGCAVADEPDAFAREVVALLAASPEERRARAAAAGVEHLGWGTQLAPVRGILDDAVQPTVSTRPSSRAS